MLRCCPPSPPSIASSSSRSSSSSPSSPEMRRAALLSLRRSLGREKGCSSLLGDAFVVRAISTSSSPSSTSSTSSSSSSSSSSSPLPPLSAALARARARAATPDLTFRVAGVSFEGRQLAASHLRKGQPVALLRERGNAFDPRAVAVETLGGGEQGRIGYVPRGETEAVLPGDADAAFAFVRSVGRAHLKEDRGGGENESENDDDEHENVEEGEREPLGPWGVSVVVKPGLPPLEIDALPAEIVAGAGPLSSALPPQEWRRLAREAAAASGFRCSVTGGVGGNGGGVGGAQGSETETETEGKQRCAPVEVHEHWRLDDRERLATLLGLRALCPEAHDVAHALSLQSPQARARALLTLRTVNGWSAEDAGVYWRGREELALSRSGSGGGGSGDGEQQKPKTKTKKKSPPPSSSWRIDARWLESQGVDLEELSPAWRQLLL